MMTLSIMTLSTMTLGITTFCHYAERRGVECRVLFNVMMNVIMLTAIMLSVIMLTAIMLSVVAAFLPLVKKINC